MISPKASVEQWGPAADQPIPPEDVDRLVAEGIAAMERGNEIDQDEMFAIWRAKYG